MRRAYADSPFGQLHYRYAAAESGAGKPAVVCFHHSPHTSEVYQSFLPALAADREVYAPDTPGFGESDPPAAQPTVDDYAAAMGPWLDGLSDAPIDLVGYHTGSLIAIETALQRPGRVRRLFLVCIPVIEEAERHAFEASPWPPPPREDGQHLLDEWRRSMEWRDPKMDIDMISESFARKLRSGPRAVWGARAAFAYPTAERLPQVDKEILCINPRDDMYEITPRAAPLIGNGRMEEVDGWGYGMFYLYGPEIAAHARAFFDG